MQPTVITLKLNRLGMNWGSEAQTPLILFPPAQGESQSIPGHVRDITSAPRSPPFLTTAKR